jgi:hypothetical protein
MPGKQTYNALYTVAHGLDATHSAHPCPSTASSAQIQMAREYNHHVGGSGMCVTTGDPGAETRHLRG